MQHYRISKRLSAFTGLILLLIVGTHVECDRQGTARRIENYGSFKSSCGDAHQVSGKVGRCLDPIFELIEGKVKVPSSDNDLIALCDRFGNAERCIRGIAKDCLTGLHKTTTSTIASAVKRFKGQECKTPSSRAKYTDPVRCNNQHAKEITSIYRNHTAMAQGIRDLPITPEEKLMKICCVLASTDREVESKFNSFCPSSTPAVMGIIRAMTDDVRATLCRNPKCQGALNSVARSPLKQQQNFIEPAMEILFMLRTD